MIKMGPFKKINVKCVLFYFKKLLRLRWTEDDYDDDIVLVLPLLLSTRYLLAGSFLLACWLALSHSCSIFFLLLLPHSYMVGM